MLHILPVGCQCYRTIYWPNLHGSSIPCRMLNLKGGTDTLSWNFGNRLPAYATWHARKAKALTRQMHKPEIFMTLWKTKKLVSLFHLIWQWECWEVHMLCIWVQYEVNYRAEKTHLKVSNRHSLLCSDILEFVTNFIIPWHTNLLTSI